MPAATKHWGDDDDDEEYETKVDEKGFKERIKVTMNAKGQRVKTTTRIRVSEVKTKIPKRVLDRMNLPRFGEATVNDIGVTSHSKEFIEIEHPSDQSTEEDSLKSLQNFMIRQQERALERDMDILDIDDDEEGKGEGEEQKEASSSKYVPPGASGRDHENTIRVSNLTKRVTEDDLRELFQRFGHIFRISLPRVEKKDEKTGQIVKEPRGFAYVAFTRKDDAEVAMDKLQGHGYDHLILKLEWAKPPSDGPGASGLSERFVSGYGQKLAQETKEQVLYASNLTGNR